RPSHPCPFGSPPVAWRSARAPRSAERSFRPQRRQHRPQLLRVDPTAHRYAHIVRQRDLDNAMLGHQASGSRDDSVSGCDNYRGHQIRQRPVIALLIRLAAPRIQKAAADAPPPRNLRHLRAGSGDLCDDPQLLFHAPPSPTFRTHENLGLHVQDVLKGGSKDVLSRSTRFGYEGHTTALTSYWVAGTLLVIAFARGGPSRLELEPRGGRVVGADRGRWTTPNAAAKLRRVPDRDALVGIA